jgi:hypothetical protein
MGRAAESLLAEPKVAQVGVSWPRLEPAAPRVLLEKG